MDGGSSILVLRISSVLLFFCFLAKIHLLVYEVPYTEYVFYTPVACLDHAMIKGSECISSNHTLPIFYSALVIRLPAYKVYGVFKGPKLQM